MFIIANIAYSQDLIITNKGDSLNCKIREIEDNFIHFTYKKDNQVINTMLPLNQIRKYEFKHFKTPVLDSQTLQEINHKPLEKFKHLRIALSGGLSMRTSPKITDSILSNYSYYRGYILDGDITYYFWEHMGLGYKLNYYYTSNTDNLYAPYQKEYINKKDNISVIFTGPEFTYRTLNKYQLNPFIFSITPGFIGYSEQSYSTINNYKATSYTAGVMLGIGYDIDITDKLALGFQLSYLAGRLTNYNYKDSKYKQYVNLPGDVYDYLTRLDLTVGLRFSK